jgi:antitoxin HicB
LQGFDRAGSWMTSYPIVIEPLAPEDGGGFGALVPDLPGCMSDGATPQEAVVSVQEAIVQWIEAARDLGHVVPEPSRHLAPGQLIFHPSSTRTSPMASRRLPV